MKLDLSSTVRGAPWNETVSVAPSASVRSVATIMARYQLGAVVVQPDEDADAGIVTERDLVRLVAAGGDPDRVEARDVMSVNLVTVDVAAPLGEAVSTMVTHGVRHLAVVDGPEIVGVLSARDLLGLVADQRPDDEGDDEDEDDADAGGDDPDAAADPETDAAAAAAPAAPSPRQRALRS